MKHSVSYYWGVTLAVFDNIAPMSSEFKIAFEKNPMEAFRWLRGNGFEFDDLTIQERLDFINALREVPNWDEENENNKSLSKDYLIGYYTKMNEIKKYQRRA